MGPSLTGVAESWVSGRGAAFWSLDSDWGGGWSRSGRVRILDSWILETGRAGEGGPWAVGYWILGFWNLAVGQVTEGRRILDSWILDSAAHKHVHMHASWVVGHRIMDLGFLDSGFCCTCWAVGRSPSDHGYWILGFWILDLGFLDLGFLDSGFCA